MATKTINWEEISFKGYKTERVKAKKHHYRIRKGSILDVASIIITCVIMFVAIFGWVYLFAFMTA